MKAGIVGMGTVGRAAAAAMLQRGSCRELVLVNRRREVAEAVALDLRYGVPVGPAVTVRAGDYDDLRGAGVVVIAAGVNEKSGGATDRNDPEGRLKLIDANVPVMRAVVPPAVAAAPEAVLLVVPDPPDPLADLARQLAGHDRVVSSGTLLDSLRFRTHLAEALGVDPRSVQANVLGEHGTSAVEHWSAVEVGGVPLAAVLERVGKRIGEVRPRVEEAVRGANLNIIQGIGASQYGIGAVTARLVEAVLRDERVVVPVGSYRPEAGVTYSLPSVVGAVGVLAVLEPQLDAEERAKLDHSIDVLRHAAQRLRRAAGA